MLLFNRQSRLIVGDLDTQGLRINFNVEKSLVGYPNLANIKVYNLKASNRQLIEKDGLEVQLYAGYEDLVLLFKGQIINVVHQKQGTDWISTIYAGDSTQALNEATINKTLAAGITPEQILTELTGEIKGVTKGLTEGVKNCISGKQSLLRGLILSGSVRDFLRQLADD